MYKALMWLPLLMIGIGSPTLAAVPDAWKHTAYAYEARKTDLATALADFAKEFGIALDMAAIQGTVDGRIHSQTPQEFLDRLGQEHHFQWFVYNETLYISPTSEQTSERIEVSPEAVDDLQQALSDVGLLDKRFGWGALPDEGVVLVRGPAKYLDFVRSYSMKVEAPEKAEKQDIVVLPLKYANAADRTIRYRDQQLTVAGVASILQELLESRSRGESINGVSLLRGQGVAGSSTSGSTTSSSLDYGGIGAQGFDPGAIEQGLDRVLGSRGGHVRSSSEEKGRSKIRVSADVRNNAVLIYDLPKRRAMYEKLVKELDTPRKLIEIDAVILDIDRNELAQLSSRWNFKGGSVSGGANLFEQGTRTTMFIQDAGKFSADLHALEGNGAASVIGNPSILTLENQPAVIDFSRTEYLTATSERVADIQAITAGTSLQVIPRSLDLNGDFKVQLVVDIEDGQIDTSRINEDQPAVRKGNVSTQAVVAEHGSLVIGGFHGLETTDKVNKIPLLGDIPIIGKLLFQSRSREMNQRERLFILTPRLIGDQINPARYVQNGNPHDVDAQMKRVNERRDGGEQATRNDVQDAFSQLLDDVTPLGFSSVETLPFESDSLCDLGTGLSMDRDRSQWFTRQDWGIAVVVARNITSKPVRIDESRCGGRWVIGVSAWPRAWLQPGAESEIYIAMRKPQVSSKAKQNRLSLLKGAAR
jgi:type III secretion protein C